MQLLATAEEMQQFDRTAIEKYGITGLLLMENAGRAFVDVLNRKLKSLGRHNVVIVCGKGNNGGDGFVIARHLANRGCGVHVGLLCRRKDVKGDAKVNLDILLKMARKHSGISFTEISSRRSLTSISSFPGDAKPVIFVDAIFGTGFSGSVRGLYKDVIEWLKSQESFVASVDIPSGINASNGVIENVAVKANLTVTMGLEKIGHYVGAGREHSGQVDVVDISIPSFVFQPSKQPAFRVQLEDVRRLLPRRKPTAHKYTVGKVFVLSGSKGFAGTPVMTSQAVMRTGAGLSILGVPKSIHSVLTRRLTEVVVKPLEETSEGSISLAALPDIQDKVHWADVLAIGPGMSLNNETQEVVRELVRSSDKPIVLDADGLTAVAADTALLKHRKSPTVLTPHTGELHRLIGADATEIERDRVEVARRASKMLKSIVVLKGSPTATGNGSVFLNSTGNPGMATGGAGDVLTGIIASLMAQGMDAEEAAYCGVFLHGLAGDIAATRFGERSMMALDILDCIPEALKRIEQDEAEGSATT